MENLTNAVLLVARRLNVLDAIAAKDEWGQATALGVWHGGGSYFPHDLNVAL